MAKRAGDIVKPVAKQLRHSGNDLFIVDNTDNDWKVLNYLREWTEIAHQFDVATGYFEIGALLALDGQWQKLDKLRILMGTEVTKRTQKALLAGLADAIELKLDGSIEQEKEQNDFLSGVGAIVDALARCQIECRVFDKKKFHAKAYITHSRLAVVGSSALVGSSNFTYPGLTDNVELNVQLRREVDILQEWYERHWEGAVDITPDILKIIERHTREYPPFEIYGKALHEYFRGHQMEIGEWEKNHSEIYPLLAQYQKDGYGALMKIGSEFGGAFLCDGVGLGKTFVGLMLIERLVKFDRKRVALFVPLSARKPVWEAALSRYLPSVGRGVFSNLAIFNHTDLSKGGDMKEQLDQIRELADVVIVDEAHHFRNPGTAGEGAKGPSRYRRFFDIVEGKTLFMLTATPVNNRLIDLQHMIELFSRRTPDYFRSIGIHSLPGHFRKMEKDLAEIIVEKEAGGGNGDRVHEAIVMDTNEAEAETVLGADVLFRSLVVQRSRIYVKASQQQLEGSGAIFPERDEPRVVQYSLKTTYSRVLELFKHAFAKDKPLFSLAIYYPLAYYKGEKDEVTGIEFQEGRQKQVVSLIRTLFLKRFESSPFAFQASCESLLLNLLTWVTGHSESKSEVNRLERWKNRYDDLIETIRRNQRDLLGNEDPGSLCSRVATQCHSASGLSAWRFRIRTSVCSSYGGRESRRFSCRNHTKQHTRSAEST